MATATYELIVTFININDRTIPSDTGNIADSDNWIRLEQHDEEKSESFYEWVDDQGLGTNINSIFDYYDQYQSKCNDSGVFITEIYVYKSPSDLKYTLEASYGTLSDSKKTVTEIHTRSISINGESEYDLEEEISRIYSAVWEGKVLNEEQEVVFPPPTIDYDGTKLVWGGETVSGVIRIKYEETHDVWTLTIEPRDDVEVSEDSENQDQDELEAAYQSTVTAVYEGGSEQLEIDPPDIEGNCTGIISTRVNPDDEGGCYKRIIVYDPCDLTEPISDTLVSIDCPEEEEEVEEEEE